MKKILSEISLGEYIFIMLFGLLLAVSGVFHFSFVSPIARNFRMFFAEMAAFLPLMFILIGIIDVWFPKEKVERHIGKGSGFKGAFWMILLATFQAGPLYGAFPVTYLLWKKGCSVRNIFIYLGAFSTMKLPMLTFEIGFLGLKFSLLRTLFTLPVFIGISFIMEKYLREKQFEVKQP